MIPPLIPYKGSKRKLVSEFKPFLPEKFNNFYDLFAGSGAVTGMIDNSIDCYMNDINTDLINMYNAIKNDVNTFINGVDYHCKEINKFPIDNDHERKQYYDNILLPNFNNNRDDSSLFFVVYFHSFRNILEYDKDGYLKTAYQNFCYGGRCGDRRFIGNKRQRYIKAFNAWSDRLKNTFLSSKNYLDFSDIKGSNFIYLDPPYHGTSGYSVANDWNKEDSLELCSFAAHHFNNGNVVWISNLDKGDNFWVDNLPDGAQFLTFQHQYSLSKSKKKINELLCILDPSGKKYDYLNVDLFG